MAPPQTEMLIRDKHSSLFAGVTNPETFETMATGPNVTKLFTIVSYDFS
jgi:hypothetical protein